MIASPYQQAIPPEEAASKTTVVVEEDEIKQEPQTQVVPKIPHPETAVRETIQATREDYRKSLKELQHRGYREDYEAALRNNKALDAQLIRSVADMAGIDLGHIEDRLRAEIAGDEEKLHHFKSLLEEVHSGKEALIGLS